MPDSPDNQHPEAFINAEFSEVVGRVVAILRRERPQVLLGYDDHEWYPHPDHLLVREVAIAAFEAAADPGAFPEAGSAWIVSKLYAPTWTTNRVSRLHRAMVERGLESPYGQRMETLGERVDDHRRITSVDVADQIEVARRALLAHRTQIDPNGHWFQAPAALVREVYPYEDFELIESRVGWDPESHDLFSGV